MTDTQKDELIKRIDERFPVFVQIMQYENKDHPRTNLVDFIVKEIAEAEMRGRHKGIKNLYETIRGDDAEFSDDFVGKQFRNYVRGGGWDQPFKSNLTDK